MIEKLTKKQARAIPFILQGKTIAEGCEKAGISLETFYQWMRIPVFQEEFQRQRKAIVDSALHTLKLSSSRAAETLISLLDSDREDIRFKNACAMLEHIGRLIEVEDIEERLSALERRLNGANK